MGILTIKWSQISSRVYKIYQVHLAKYFVGRNDDRTGKNLKD